MSDEKEKGIARVEREVVATKSKVFGESLALPDEVADVKVTAFTHDEVEIIARRVRRGPFGLIPTSTGERRQRTMSEVVAAVSGDYLTVEDLRKLASAGSDVVESESDGEVVGRSGYFDFVDFVDQVDDD